MITAKDASIRPAQRVEVFTGTGRRGTWLREEEVRIVAEIASSGTPVCEAARRHGLSPQQLFGWRRRLRDAEAASAEPGGLEFVPAVVEADPPPVASRSKGQAIAGTIAGEIGGA